MNLARARKLKPGSFVECPAYRGERAFRGKITTAEVIIKSAMMTKNRDGIEYIWIEVQGPKHKSVWPSNLLG